MAKQLIYEVLEPYHRRFLLPLFTDESVCRYLFLPLDDHSYQKQIDDMLRHKFNQYWVIKHPKNKAIIGLLSIEYHELFERYEVNCRIVSAYQQQGFGKEALGYAIKYGFKQLKVSAVYAQAHEDNAIARRVAQRLGMTEVERNKDQFIVYKINAMCTL